MSRENIGMKIREMHENMEKVICVCLCGYVCVCVCMCVYVNPEGKKKMNERQALVDEIITGHFPEHWKVGVFTSTESNIS